jgi:maltooligosyltrehalose trehalohydrolase
MKRWQTWAPKAKKVELHLGSTVVAAEPSGDGWWWAPFPAPGTDYTVSLDGGPRRPDPRSRLQPNGVHAASRAVDPSFAWTDRDFRATPLSRGVLYELHVGTFTPGGTFDSAIERLEALVDLGVTHVEVMPVNAFPGQRGWGYDGVALFAVQAAYGGVDGLRRFVNAAHGRGLSVVLDVVYNHLGPDGNYLGEFGPFFTDRFKTPWGAAIDFSVSGVRRFFIDNALYWLRDCHLDGLRLDATHAIYDESPTHILAELSDAVRALGGQHVLIAENEHNEPRLIRPRAQGGDGLDGFWFDDFHHAVHAAFTGERQGYYAKYGALSAIAETLKGPSRGVACIQNHDQIGNRARGERLGHLISPGRLRLASALLLTSPFVPLLFQGEEWGASSPFQYFTDHQDEKLAQAVRDGRRAEHASVVGDPSLVPDPQDPETMRRSVLDWSEREGSPTLEWYRALIALRRELPESLDVRVEGQTITVKRGPMTLIGSIADVPVKLATPPGEPVLAFPSAPKDGVIAPDSCAIWLSR